MIKNPVMFVVEAGSVLTTVIWLRDLVAPPAGAMPAWFTAQVALWLWFTVLFANFAEALAEGRGKAQAAALRGLRKETVARKRIEGREAQRSRRRDLRKGDVVVVEAGQVIPGDGEVIEGIASVDESAVTGESAPVIRESGGDRSAVTGGTKVLSDRIVVRIGADPGHSFLDRMIGLVEGAQRQKTPNEIALNVLLSGHDDHLPDRLRHASCPSVSTPAPVLGDGDRRPAGVPDSHHHRRPALRHRHRRDGPADPPQRDPDERPRGGGGGRRGHHAARQDRDHHLRQPDGDGVHRRAGCAQSRSSPTRPSSPAWPTRRPEGRSIVVLAKEKHGLRARELKQPGARGSSPSRRDAHERLRPGRAGDPQGGRRRHRTARRVARRQRAGRRRPGGLGDREDGGHAPCPSRTARACSASCT